MQVQDEDTAIRAREKDDVEPITNPVDGARKNWVKDSLTSFMVFLWTSFSLSVAEIVVIGFDPRIPGSSYFAIQVVILAVSSGLCLVGIMMTASHFPEDDELTGDLEQYRGMSYLRKCYTCMDGEVFLEISCLLFGWGSIFMNPGLAVLRSFRFFRYMWYFELVAVDKTEDPDYEPEEHFISLGHAANLVLFYIEQLGAEFLTEKSRGGFVILLMFFMLTYIMSVVFWLDMGASVQTTEGRSCEALGACYIRRE